MQSFYGGRQGISFILKKSFTSVSEMEEFFAKGAETTSEVGYGEYVVINTSYSKDSTNGQVYKRGFEGADGPICNILGPMGDTPSIELTSEEDVSAYIVNNSSLKTKYPDTWKADAGKWELGKGTEVTIYRLITNPVLYISETEYNALSPYGKNSYDEVDSVGYIRMISYYLHINGVNIISDTQYDKLSTTDKANYSICYINKTNSSIRINETTYNSYNAATQANYKLYKVSDPSDIVMQNTYDEFSTAKKAKYEVCYVEKVYGQEFISATEYDELSSTDQDKYNPYEKIFYLKEDNTKKISIYAYNLLSDIGQDSYTAETYKSDNGLHAPSKTSDSCITYAYANVLDDDGNVTSALIGFSFPYYEENFYYKVTSPYNSDGSIKANDQEVQMSYRKNSNLEDINYNYYKEWTLSVPRGVQGDSITTVFIAPSYAPAGTSATNINLANPYILTNDTPFTSFELNSLGVATYGEFVSNGLTYEVDLSNLDTAELGAYYWMEITDYSESKTGTKKYSKIAEYQTIRKIAIADHNGVGYNIYDMLVLYQDSAHRGNITYDGEDYWVNIGNTRGRIQGLRVFAVFDSVTDLDAAIAGDPSPETLAQNQGIADYDNCEGWGVIALNGLDADGNQTASLYYYDYGNSKWKKCSSNIGSLGGDPYSSLYIGDTTITSETEASNLLEGGIWFVRDTIKAAY